MKKRKWIIVFLLIFGISQIFAATCGDVNASGETDIVDALLIARYYVNLDPANFDSTLADVNGDNMIDIVDALLVARYYVGLIDTLDGCEPTGPCEYEFQAETHATWEDADIIEIGGVIYVDTCNSNGTWIQWNIDVGSATNAVCKFRYACASDVRSMQLIVNNNIVDNLVFPASGSWSTWMTEEASVSLIAGLNTIRVTAVTYGGAPNMDKMDITLEKCNIVTPAPTPCPTYTSATPEGWTPPPNLKPRIIVTTDGEIDDRSSMVRFLVSSSDYNVEGIIQVCSRYAGIHSKDKWIENELDLYEQSLPNLRVHNPDYPSSDYLRSVLMVGNEDVNDLYRAPPDMRTKDTPGEQLIINKLLDDDPRPIHVVSWAGANTTASALWRLKYTGEYTTEQFNKAVSKIRIYCIWYQDGGGSWIEENVKEAIIYEAYRWDNVWDYQSLTGLSPDEVKEYMTRDWLDENVKENHGALGEYTPQSYVSEGDTPAFLHLINNGLESHTDYTLGGWGGRAVCENPDYTPNHLTDKEISDDGDNNKMFWRWVIPAQNDFAARMDWCVASSYNGANHQPIAAVAGDLTRRVTPGETVYLDASGSTDPDGNELTCKWWQYHDADSVEAKVSINNDTSMNNASFTVPDEPGKQIHIILEVKDDGNPPLINYKRIFFNISAPLRV